MSPINPPAPTPPIEKRVKTAVQIATRKHQRTIEVVSLGLVLGLLVFVVRPDAPVLGAMVIVAYALGAAAEAIVTRGR